jgi:hypothetical protein
VTPNAFLDALIARDISRAPLAEDVSYQSPLTGDPVQGRDRVSRFLGIYLPVITDVRLKRHIADGDHVASIVQADTTFGPIALVYVFSIEAGQIAEIQGFYDPRGFLERMGTHAGA